MSTEKTNFYNSARVKRGFYHFLVGKGITSIASFLVAILIVRELSINDYASYTAISGLLITFMLISNFGIERTVPKYIAKAKQTASELELKKLTVKLIQYRLLGLFITTSGMITFSNVIFSRFGIEFNADILTGFCLYAFGFGMSMHMTRTLQALLMQKEATFTMSIEWFCKLSVILLLVYAYDAMTLSNVLYVQAGTILLSLSFATWRLLHAVRTAESSVLQGSVINNRELFRFSLNNYLQTLAGFHCNASTNKLVGSALLAPSSVASLGFAYSITSVFQRYLPSQLFIGLIEPVIMGRFSKSRDFSETRLYTGVLFKINLFIVMPAVVWVMVDGRFIIEVITKGKYGDTAWLIGSLLIALILESQRAILQLISNAVDRSELLLKTNLYTLIMLPVLILLTINFNLHGLIIGILLTLLLRNCILEVMLVKLSFRMPYDFLAIVKIVITSFISVFLTNNFNLFEFLTPVISSIINLALVYLSYLICLAILKPFSSEERTLLNGFIGKKVFIW
tara:strand:- start:12587 stop:14122 length:1536 start_codon:yes stop_codon:yes gene_type:complete